MSGRQKAAAAGVADRLWEAENIVQVLEAWESVCEVTMGVNEEKSIATENTRLRQLLAQAGISAAEHKVAEQLQRILVEELHHRVKNTLAIVHSIIRQSLQSADSVAEAREAIENRLLALGRVHDLLLRTSWASAKLADLLQLATEPFDHPGAGQFLIQASDLEVSSGASLPLAMTLNELSTNAVKYGALSSPSGRVTITTKVDDGAKQFRLTWTETGGPPVREPARRGFGTRLIEKSFVEQLEGNAKLRFEPTGVVCELDIPLAVLQPVNSN